MISPDNQAPLAALRRSWLQLAILSLMLLLPGYFLFARQWNPTSALQWLLQSALILGFQLIVFWRDLSLNHRPAESQLLPSFGWGTQISLLRMLSIGLLAGFFLLPYPPGWMRWLPPAIYLLANLSDFFDGYLARISNHVTLLGQKLDIDLDGRGLLIASLLAFQYGKVPWWFLLVGFARYAFIIGMRLRERRGLPIYDLPANMNRRGLAGTQMVFTIAMLVPIFSPPETELAASLFALPFLGNFLADWWQVSGQEELFNRWTSFWKGILSILADKGALVIRVLTAAVIIWRFVQFPSSPLLTIFEFLGAAALLLGAAGQSAAALLLIETGLRQQIIVLGPSDWAVLIGASLILFMGTGALSIWKPEMQLISRRSGDRQADE